MGLTFLEIGTNGNDSLPGTSGEDVMFALAGADTVAGNEGSDTIFGQEGNDTLAGGIDADKLFGGIGNDSLNGGSGNDTLTVEADFGNFGTDTLLGSTGFDRVVFETASIITVNEQISSSEVFAATHGVVVNLINQFQPGTVRDFGQTALDANGELVTDISATLRGRIVDGTAATFSDIEMFELTEFDDVFFDSSANHIIDGGDGDDFISGGGGIDNIIGGEGNDTALYRFSTSGVTVVLLDFGGGGSGSGGEAAGDRLFDIENAFGSDFADNLIGAGDANLLSGFDGGDTLVGGVGLDTLAGGDGADKLIAGGDADTLQGGADADTLDGGSGNDSLDGGTGSDTATLQSWNSVSAGGLIRGVITLGDGNAAGSAIVTRTFFGGGFPLTVELERETLRSIENVVGSDFSETITGNNAGNLLEGRGSGDLIDGRLGNDSVMGGDGDDRLSGGPGALLNFPSLLAPDNDLVHGGAGNDTVDYTSSTGFVVVTLGQNGADGSAIEFVPLSPVNPTQIQGSVDVLRLVENVIGSAFADALIGNEGNNRLSGGGNNDNLVGGLGDDTLDGGTGVNAALFNGIAAAVTVDLLAGTASGQGSDTLIGIRKVVGSSLGDTILGSPGDETLEGGGGNDSLAGREGADLLVGGLGGDTLNGGGGLNDTADYSASSAGVDVDLVTRLGLGGEAQNDSLAGVEHLTGSGADDTLTGNGQANRLDGRNGGDLLTGGGGADTLIGGAGADTLTGAAGADSLSGGADADTFDFNAPAQSSPAASDTVADFATGDLIDLVNIDARADVNGNQQFDFIETDLFTGVSGQLRFSTDGIDSFVQGDVDGDAAADFVIRLLRVTSLVEADFVL